MALTPFIINATSARFWMPRVINSRRTHCIRRRLQLTINRRLWSQQRPWHHMVLNSRRVHRRRHLMFSVAIRYQCHHRPIDGHVTPIFGGASGMGTGRYTAANDMANACRRTSVNMLNANIEFASSEQWNDGSAARCVRRVAPVSRCRPDLRLAPHRWWAVRHRRARAVIIVSVLGPCPLLILSSASCTSNSEAETTKLSDLGPQK